MYSIIDRKGYDVGVNGYLEIKSLDVNTDN